MVVKFYTLFAVFIVCPLLLHHIAAWCVPRWIDGLLAWIYIKLLMISYHSVMNTLVKHHTFVHTGLYALLF